jgi:hypothetical protein
MPAYGRNTLAALFTPVLYTLRNIALRRNWQHALCQRFGAAHGQHYLARALHLWADGLLRPSIVSPVA